jgi:arylsulfatase A-like enzyme
LVGARRKAIASIRASWFKFSRLLYRLGVLDNPLATVTGHGYHVYDSLVRVPFLVAGGPVRQHPRISEQVRQIDIMPTILDLVGLAEVIPPNVDGRSLAPLMQGDSLPEAPAFIETCQNSREPSSFYGVRFGGFKYAYDAASSQVPQELYNLSSDPEETDNLVKSMPQKAAELRKLIEAHVRQAQSDAVSMNDEISDVEMGDLTEHLRKLGYVE